MLNGAGSKLYDLIPIYGDEMVWDSKIRSMIGTVSDMIAVVGVAEPPPFRSENLLFEHRRSELVPPLFTSVFEKDRDTFVEVGVC